MNIPPQEDWSPELLSELQRAVPVLENSSFELGAGFGGNSSLLGAGNSWASSQSVGAGHTSHDETTAQAGNSSSATGGLATAAAGGLPGRFAADWGSWASDGAGGAAARSSGASHLVSTSDSHVDGGVSSPPTDLLSEDAMALPMSTLTSGKRRTYANKSTFQAHVCCVMDSLQVPRVLEMLQASPHFQSARHWPHAYRIISPFDKQTHEGSDDDSDPGAGEKMLGLLKRMGLENLLLIVSRWDSGPSDRLGVELFKCVNEQCKDLLKELQQAVRASFPPEELLGHNRKREQAASGDAGDTAAFLSELMDSHDDDEELDLDFDASQEEGYSYGDGGDASGSGASGVAHTAPARGAGRGGPGEAKLLDLRALGATPPSELLWAARGVCAAPARHRGPHSMYEDLYAEDPMPNVSSARAVDEWQQGLQVKRCPVSHRVNVSNASVRGGFSGTEEPHWAETTDAAVADDDAAHRGVAAEPILDLATARAAECATGNGLPRTTLSRMSSEELLRLGARLRTDRFSLESSLKYLGRAEEVIGKLHMPLFEGDASGDASAVRGRAQDLAQQKAAAAPTIRRSLLPSEGPPLPKGNARGGRRAGRDRH